MTGIAQNNVFSYWEKRAKEQGKRTVGFANKPLSEQDKNYKIRFNFIISHINTNLLTLDYGCGVGRYSKFFNPLNYIGVDITKDLLDIAKEENTQHEYMLLETPDLSNLPKLEFEQFFTATVLQHNSDEGVNEILSSLQKMKPNNIIIVLYENTSNFPNVVGKHIKFRRVEEYKMFVSKYFNIDTWKSHKHIIHGEEHSLIIFNCK